MKWFRLSLIVALTFLLSACNISPIKTLEVKKEDIGSYNALVSGTLEAYKKSVVTANDNKESLLSYALQDRTMGDLGVETYLTEEEKESFKNYSILYDRYFTSLGADSTRELLVIIGGSKTMYITAVWSSEKVEYVSRKIEG